MNGLRRAMKVAQSGPALPRVGAKRKAYVRALAYSCKTFLIGCKQAVTGPFAVDSFPSLRSRSHPISQLRTVPENREQLQPPNMALPVYTIEDLKKHTTEKSCWLVVKGKVHDVTEFLEEHPGGFDIILNSTGDSPAVSQLRHVHVEAPPWRANRRKN